jgi:hypothetical protein
MTKFLIATSFREPLWRFPNSSYSLAYAQWVQPPLPCLSLGRSTSATFPSNSGAFVAPVAAPPLPCPFTLCFLAPGYSSHSLPKWCNWWGTWVGPFFGVVFVIKLQECTALPPIQFTSGVFLSELDEVEKVHWGMSFLQKIPPMSWFTKNFPLSRHVPHLAEIAEEDGDVKQAHLEGEEVRGLW